MLAFVLALGVVAAPLNAQVASDLHRLVVYQTADDDIRMPLTAMCQAQVQKNPVAVDYQARLLKKGLVKYKHATGRNFPLPQTCAAVLPTQPD